MEYRDLIGDILKNSDQSEELPGQGKPLPEEYLKGDVYQHFQRIARDAGYLPEWIKLQKEISKDLRNLTSFEKLEAINLKVRKFNKICPPPFQKVFVTEENYDIQKERWQ